MTVIALVFVALLCPAILSEPARGAICVLAQPDHLPAGTLMGSVQYNPATLKLRIDKQNAISWPHKENLKINDLGPEERHLLTIMSDGKPVQSVWFRFTSDLDLCCLSSIVTVQFKLVELSTRSASVSDRISRPVEYSR